MNLPFQEFDHYDHILPYDGKLIYYPKIEFGQNPDAIFELLLNQISWYHDSVRLFGKTIVTKRKIALFADCPTSYSYSNQQKRAIPWIEELLPIKEIVEKVSEERFNCCLCNLYHHGEEGMGWHSDNEKALDPEASIASVSFGIPRFFHIKHKKSKEIRKLQLENGSLLLMKAPTQEHWLHSLPKSKKIHSARINLTFRTLRHF